MCQHFTSAKHKKGRISEMGLAQGRSSTQGPDSCLDWSSHYCSPLTECAVPSSCPRDPSFPHFLFIVCVTGLVFWQHRVRSDAWSKISVFGLNQPVELKWGQIKQLNVFFLTSHVFTNISQRKLANKPSCCFQFESPREAFAQSDAAQCLHCYERESCCRTLNGCKVSSPGKQGEPSQAK